jgi:hypothetical protein
MKLIRIPLLPQIALYCLTLAIAVQLGCEQAIPLPITAQPSDTIEIQEATTRSSYRWLGGQSTFESVALSPLNFFEKSRDAVSNFLESQPFNREPKALFVPDGISSQLLQLVDRVKYPGTEMTTVASITLSDKQGIFVLSRGGSKAAVCDSGKLVIWDLQTGRIERNLESRIENASQIVFNNDGTSLFVANQNALARIEIENDRIGPTTQKFPSPIVQVNIAVEVDKLVVRCEKGEILITDEKLEVLTQLPKATVKSAVAISDRGDRIAFWNGSTPTEVELKGLDFGRRAIVENIKYNGGDQHAVCGRFTTQWIHGRELFHWWHNEIGKPFSDRQWVASDLTWNPITFASTSPMENSDSRLMIASRKNGNGEKETVISDINCYSQISSQPTILPGHPTSVSVSYKGDVVAYKIGADINVFRRVQWQYSSHESLFYDAFSICMDASSPEQLDLVGEFILKNDFWWHYGFSAQDVFTQFAQIIGESWINMEQEAQPSQETETNLDALEEWLDGKSDLACASSGSRRIFKARRAAGVSDPRWFSAEGRKIFYEEMKKLRSDISPMLRKENPCSAAYDRLLYYTLVTDSDLDEVDSILQQAVSKHPDCVQPYITTIPMLTEQWLGNTEDVNTFARELRMLYGSEFGTMIYPRLCIATRRMFRTHQLTWQSSKLNIDTMIEGLDLLASRKALPKKTFNSAFYMFYSRENVDRKLRNIVNHYVEQNAFVPIMLPYTNGTDSSEVSNAARYHILRYLSQLYGEPLPEFFE